MIRSSAIRLPVAALILSSTPLLAEEPPPLSPPPTLDDRSDPESLIRSLYNAVNRREFARAWSYFSVLPSKSYDAFADGYADTAFVDVATGRPVSEGAAGSIFHMIPVAIRATDARGNETAFSGCYTIRQVNPQMQEPPFRPLSIEKGALKPVEAAGFLVNALPESCGGQTAEAPDAAELTAKATALFRAGRRADCNLADDQKEFLSGRQPESFELKFKHSWEGPEDAEHKALLIRFACATYAYNVSEAYYLADEDGVIHEVGFAEPDLDIAYADDTNEKVKSLKVNGFSATPLLVNSQYDADRQTITSFSKWRGVGDAFSAGTWEFRQGRFVLTSFLVDAAYDGAEEPVEVLELDGAR